LGLDKIHLNHLTYEECTYHVFYQFLASTTTAEQDHFNLKDVSNHTLLVSFSCYRLLPGPFSDDSIMMADLQTAMCTLMLQTILFFFSSLTYACLMPFILLI
jgi:chitin synthase